MKCFKAQKDQDKNVTKLETSSIQSIFSPNIKFSLFAVCYFWLKQNGSKKCLGHFVVVFVCILNEAVSLSTTTNYSTSGLRGKKP